MLVARREPTEKSKLPLFMSRSASTKIAFTIIEKTAPVKISEDVLEPAKNESLKLAFTSVKVPIV